MYYNFDTSNENAGIAALLVYGIYRSRDTKRFKVTPDIWGIIERGVKSSAKRAMDLTDFIEKLKPKLHCSTIQPRHMQLNDQLLAMYKTGDGSIVHKWDKGKRQFWTEILEAADNEAVMDVLYKKTSLVVALVRERLEREKPIEAIILKEEEQNGEIIEY